MTQFNTYEIWALGHENAGGYYEPVLLGTFKAINEDIAMLMAENSSIEWDKYRLRTIEARKV